LCGFGPSLKVGPGTTFSAPDPKREERGFDILYRTIHRTLGQRAPPCSLRSRRWIDLLNPNPGARPTRTSHWVSPSMSRAARRHLLRAVEVQHRTDRHHLIKDLPSQSLCWSPLPPHEQLAPSVRANPRNSLP
jgi:hypothetical protein